MKLKQFIFLALLFAGFLFSSSTAVTEKSQDETKLHVDETKKMIQGDDAKYIRGRPCRYYCGRRCCSYAEAQLLGAQAKDDKLEVEEVNQVEDAKYPWCKYRCCHPRYGCRCCGFAEIIAEELSNRGGGVGEANP